VIAAGHTSEKTAQALSSYKAVAESQISPTVFNENLRFFPPTFSLIQVIFE
jgi:hypothetical protein